jgi:hypothetical protein
MLRWIATALIPALAAAGCAATFDFRREELFESSAKRYAQVIRWSDFEAARAFLSRAAAEERRVGLEQVRVTDYRVRSLAYAPGVRQAVQLVEISYHKIDDPRIRRLEDRQIWDFDAERGAWLLSSGLPAF